MNPKEFPWNEDQQVTVRNPTSDDYKFMVHNKNYAVGAGKVVKMPGYIAWVFVYGLATQVAQNEDVFARWNEIELRKEYYDKLIVGVEETIQAVEEVPADPAVSTFDEADVPAGDSPEDEFSDEDNGDDDATVPPAQPPRDTKGIKPMKPATSNKRA